MPRGEAPHFLFWCYPNQIKKDNYFNIGNLKVYFRDELLSDQNSILQDGQVTASIQAFLCVFYHS